MPDITITSNAGMALSAAEAAIERALIKIGLTAEAYAKIELTDSGAVDTGRLRNSVTYATSTKHGTGEFPAEPQDYTPHGSPAKGEAYIGTNVEYAPYIELGTVKMKARPYLRPAIEKHIQEYRDIFKSELQGI